MIDPTLAIAWPEGDREGQVRAVARLLDVVAAFVRTHRWVGSPAYLLVLEPPPRGAMEAAERAELLDHATDVTVVTWGSGGRGRAWLTYRAELFAELLPRALECRPDSLVIMIDDALDRDSAPSIIARALSNPGSPGVRGMMVLEWGTLREIWGMTGE